MSDGPPVLPPGEEWSAPTPDRRRGGRGRARPGPRRPRARRPGRRADADRRGVPRDARAVRGGRLDPGLPRDGRRPVRRGRRPRLRARDGQGRPEGALRRLGHPGRRARGRVRVASGRRTRRLSRRGPPTLGIRCSASRRRSARPSASRRCTVTRSWQRRWRRRCASGARRSWSARSRAVARSECAVLGNDDPVASIAGEIVPKGHEFYDYEAKYLDDHGSELLIPAADLGGDARGGAAARRGRVPRRRVRGDGAGRLLPRVGRPRLRE